MSQVVKHLPNKHKPLHSDARTVKKESLSQNELEVETQLI
jgi:hypothetical protein